MVQGLRLCTLTAKGLGSIPGWGTKTNVLHSVVGKINKNQKQANKKTVLC